MNRYFTIMIIPEREKGVRTIRIPRPIFKSLAFFLAAGLVTLGILSYDYWKILKQVYENKHLSIENRQLKEQIELFQMKINAVTEDIERIEQLEYKLRVLTGLEQVDMTKSVIPLDSEVLEEGGQQEEEKKNIKNGSGVQNSIKDARPENEESMGKNPEFQKLKDLYERKMATSFGLQESYTFTKDWSRLTQQSFSLARDFAKFDFRYNAVKTAVSTLEENIHKLDQFILDREAFIRSTPSILPTHGWITSYYGPRLNPISRVLKMHEGIDIGARSGQAIVAPADGIVTFSGRKDGFGVLVQVDHGYGVETIFAHASSKHVERGQIVKRGQLIAKVGSTGHSTGPHLHYEIRVNGTPVDPLYFVLN